MTLYRPNELKAATSSSGVLGPLIRLSQQGGHLVGMIGAELSVKKSEMGTSGTIGALMEYRSHIGIPIQLSMFKWVFLAIPKEEVIEWGVLDLGSVPLTTHFDHSSAIVGLLLYGPIGMLVGSAMDKSSAQKQAKKPVLGITYRTNHSENAIFIDSNVIKWFHYLYDFMNQCHPDKLKE